MIRKIAKMIRPPANIPIGLVSRLLEVFSGTSNCSLAEGGAQGDGIESGGWVSDVARIARVIRRFAFLRGEIQGY
jgi:hypothetical protein